MSAVAGFIDSPDHPTPPRRCLPRVIVASASEAGPRHAVTRPHTCAADFDVETTLEDSSPRLLGRPRR
ncbi:hypothetical protein [Nannocystis punicea]|uniref:Uncharacterized protein n=1 Tax=Nannocystis punicea TaxID=2995304 RepID=A0ABY7HD54_9BACT|nr:hypothetical protein [Nannocystis poenicansa]WAS97221.1 hypothetical protein O0S08_13825 [Nannocystis poenicansa]